MKDIFCLAAFAGKVLCLVVFVSALKPDSIGVVQASTKPADCRIERSATQECGLNLLAAASQAAARPCLACPGVAH